ncbi:MAG: hypothetical protein M3O61_07290 [Gemmatimonadota bacterium]|nr:hypothetical protein [Gemmatimonadota bacterium]
MTGSLPSAEQVDSTPDAPRWQRLIVATLIGLFGMSLTLRGLMKGGGVGQTDLGQVWFAASAILHRADPYQLVGPTGFYHHEFTLFYPLTAAVAILPLGLLDEAVASAVFAFIASAVLAYAVTKKGWDRLPIFVSLPFLIAAHQAQFSPMIAAGFLLPAVAWTWAAKPTIGLALLASTGSVRAFIIAIVGGAILVLIGLAFVPQWPAEWLRNVRPQTHMIAPIVRPGGFLALAALLRWRRPEARLVAAMTLIPQTTGWWDLVLLLLVAETFRESLLLAVTTMAPLAYEMAFGLGDGILDLYPRSSLMLMAASYIPATIIVLRRPNEGPLPAWAELIRRQLVRKRTA